MRRWLTCLLLLAAALPALANVGTLRQPSVLGDARYGALRVTTNAQRIAYAVDLPPGRHAGFTVVAWMRVTSPANPGYLTTYASWCGDPIQRSNPDLAANAFGYQEPAGTNLTAAGGSITIASFPFAGYTGIPVVSNRWPRGVYTIAGWADEAVTVTLGGTDIVVGPGEFNRNALPGAAASVVLSGAGAAAIGISRTPCASYQHVVDGVAEGNVLTADSIVTNSLRLCSWRFRIDGPTQSYRSDMGGLDSFDVVSLVRTNAAPACGAYDSDGDYEVGLKGLSTPPWDHAIFDARLFPWYLSDADLRRIHNNGVSEIIRRNLEPIP